MKPIQHSVCVPLALLLATLFTAGLAQADNNKRSPKEAHKTAELNITQAGAGQATVTSSPSGIDCGAACSALYDWGTQVTLAATPATGSIFESWSGACAGNADTCTVTLDQAQQVSAGFALMKMT
jgi:hypothetical protein